MGRGFMDFLARRAVPCLASMALLLSGCSLLPAGLAGPAFEAETLASPDAWSFTTLTLRPSIQQALYVKELFDRFATSQAADVLGQLPTPSGRSVSLEKDVLPRLDGEIAYAISGTIDQPLGVLLIHTSDVNGTLGLLADESTPALTRDARGATRYTGIRYMAAGYKNWVVYTSDAPTLDQTLDRIDHKGGPSLATSQRYTSAVQRLTGDRLAYGYVDVTPLVQSGAFTNLRTVDPALARGRLAYSLALAGGPEPQLRVLETRLESIPDRALPTSTAPAGDALLAMDRLPVGNAVAVAGPSIGRLAESVRAAAPDDVPDDVLAFLHAFAGPFAVGVSPEPGSRIDMLGGLDASVFFLGQFAPDADVDAFQDLAAAIVDDGAGDNSSTYQHQVVTDNGWLAVNVVPTAVGLDAIPQDELASNRVYQWVRPGLTQDGTNVFIDLRSLLAFGTANRGASSEDLALLEPLRAFGATYHMDNDGSGHSRMQLIVSLTD